MPVGEATTTRAWRRVWDHLRTENEGQETLKNERLEVRTRRMEEEWVVVAYQRVLRWAGCEGVWPVGGWVGRMCCRWAVGPDAQGDA